MKESLVSCKNWPLFVELCLFKFPLLVNPFKGMPIGVGKAQNQLTLRLWPSSGEKSYQMCDFSNSYE